MDGDLLTEVEENRTFLAVYAYYTVFGNGYLVAEIHKKSLQFCDKGCAINLQNFIVKIFHFTN